MGRLFWNQLLYLWQIIRTRLIMWLILICLAIGVVSAQLVGNPYTSGFTLFFQGVTFQEIHFPAFWFSYFAVPLLILLNGLRQLWETRTMHLRGLQFAPYKFALINLVLLVLLTLFYVGITIFTLAVCTSLFKLPGLQIGQLKNSQAILSLSVINCLGIYFLLLLQILFSNLHPAIGVIVPFSMLIMTPYTAWHNNPLNALMLARVSRGNILLLILATLITAIIYLITDYFVDLNLGEVR
ncbi:rhodopsin [Lactobacillus sp. ESL0791]|uniref:rhodopsin n=1 Tax=Lactobacillus sp. ESL0791 TaxID=2983234 RepID=UPI0023F7E45F|nr:rhodopsin [Lactobacillus sp. ESL0791]MDF7638421.1 rhodopsin [Lactobacillus sp. ESL0791]